jgi:hypothetical protein
VDVAKLVFAGELAAVDQYDDSLLENCRPGESLDSILCSATTFGEACAPLGCDLDWALPPWVTCS